MVVDVMNTIIFDFDGVLIPLKEVHFLSLNEALAQIAPKFVISREDHIREFDGISTKSKLRKLVLKGLDQNLIESISKRKQELTIKAMNALIKKDLVLIKLLKDLKKNNTLAVASNAVSSTVELGLKLLGISNLFSLVLSNNDVDFQKPHPQIYLKAMSELGAAPSKTIIVEDSKHGRQAAFLSGANVFTVDDPEDLKTGRIFNFISKLKPKTSKWIDSKLNVLIPMSGAGSRFAAAGYVMPKPLIDVNGVPMIKKVVDNLNVEATFIFICQQEHITKYNLNLVLPALVPNCKIVSVSGITEGAACSVLAAKHLINNEDHLVIANSDQYVEWDSEEFFYSALSKNVDASIVVFHEKDKNPKWSFAKTKDELVTEVAEKKVISDLATVGIYYFKHGKDFVSAAEQMIKKNIRVNNEFYVCPVHNEMILAGKKINTFMCKKMWGLGTPEDLELFLKNNK